MWCVAETSSDVLRGKHFPSTALWSQKLQQTIQWFNWIPEAKMAFHSVIWELLTLQIYFLVIHPLHASQIYTLQRRCQRFLNCFSWLKQSRRILNLLGSKLRHLNSFTDFSSLMEAYEENAFLSHRGIFNSNIASSRWAKIGSIGSSDHVQVLNDVFMVVTSSEQLLWWYAAPCLYGAARPLLFLLLSQISAFFSMSRTPALIKMFSHSRASLVIPGPSSWNKKFLVKVISSFEIPFYVRTTRPTEEHYSPSQYTGCLTGLTETMWDSNIFFLVCQTDRLTPLCAAVALSCFSSF